MLPGFSTADQVTNLSGRGVGMDVVKTNIEKMGGHRISTRVGEGTTFRIKIPLTLAILPSLLVRCKDSVCSPAAPPLEVIRLEGEALRTGIE